MKIVRKTIVDKKDVFDISVKDSESYVLENGIITHNSGPAYGSSIIISMSKSQEKEKKEGPVIGTGLTCKNHKNRFAKEHAKIRIVIDYESGLSKYSGLFELAEELGFLEKPTAQTYQFKGQKKSYKKTWFKENEVEFWEKELKGGFGDALNNKFKYQSHADDILDTIPENKT